MWGCKTCVVRKPQTNNVCKKYTYVFGSQELHAFGHLVGKAEQVGGGEALIHVVWQQVVTLWFRKHTQKTPWGSERVYVHCVL